MRTPSQTVGPFFAICLTKWANGPVADPDGVKIAGHVLDGAGDPVPDSMIETWDGEHFARAGTDDEGHWEVTTTAGRPRVARSTPSQAKSGTKSRLRG